MQGFKVYNRPLLPGFWNVSSPASLDLPGATTTSPAGYVQDHNSLDFWQGDLAAIQLNLVNSKGGQMLLI